MTNNLKVTIPTHEFYFKEKCVKELAKYIVKECASHERTHDEKIYLVNKLLGKIAPLIDSGKKP